MTFVDKYVEFAKPLTEASRVFHYYMGYLIVSQAVQRRAYYRGAGSFPLAPNLWMIVIGPSSMTKKSTALRIAMSHVLKEAFAEQTYRFPSEGSHESLIEFMEIQPAGLISHSEFASFMHWISRDYNSGLASLLTDLYDQPEEYSRRVGTREKSRTYSIKNPFINIATCSTVEWFAENLDENKIRGGFLPRFLLLEDPGENELIPETPPPNQKLKTELVVETTTFMNRTPGELVYTDTARQMFRDWYIKTNTERVRTSAPLLVPFLSRRITDVHKFAMLNAVMRHDSVMNESDLDLAIGIIEQVMEYTENIVGGKLALTRYERERLKVLDAIKTFSTAKSGVSHSSLMKATKLPRRVFKDVVENLIDEETIEMVKAKGISGRETITYRITMEESNESDPSKT